MIASLGTVIAAVLAVVLTQALDDDGAAQQVQPPAATAAPGETSGPTGGAAETLSPAPDETEAPAIPDNAIVSAPWNFAYTITYNECSFGLQAGELVTANLTFREARADDGYIEDLESASVYAPDGTHVVDDVFTWPTWEFESPIEGGGEVHISLTFTDARNAQGTREEVYEDGFGSTCRIVMQN